MLNEAGHEASTVHEEGLGGAADKRIAERCRAEGRALITLDVGFADIRTYRPGEHSGIIVLRLMRQNKRKVLEVIGRLVEMAKSEELAGKLWVVEGDRVRIRG